MLATGIPGYRLPRQILAEDIAFISALGVEIKLDSPIQSIEDVKSQGYSAILLATGAHKGIKLGITGEDIDGVFDGVRFLRNINLGNRVDTGNKVVVIGGGNVAIDAARSVIRLGAESITVIYRRPRHDMPANYEELCEAESEGVQILDSTSPLQILGNRSRVCKIECLRTSSGKYDSSGRRRPEIIPGSNFYLEADTVITAVGQIPDLSFLSPNTGIAINANNTIIVNKFTLETNCKGVFAAGDNVTGPSTVVDAMAEGERAAVSIDRHLRGMPPEQARVPDIKVPLDIPWNEEDVEPGARQPMPCLPRGCRNNNFNETNLGFTQETAISEAKRCLRCDLKDN